jgi:hypothetical protein
MLPPLTDFVALLGINLVLCALALRLIDAIAAMRAIRPMRLTRPWTSWMGALLFALLCWPVGMAQLPVAAYLRGVSADLSVTLVVLACLDLGQRLAGFRAVDKREYGFVFAAIALAALFLYPLALGWGDWDAYRLGWSGPALWLALLVLSLSCWARGLKLLPVLVALALLAWTAGVLESRNLWDYLIDPWLALLALCQCVKLGAEIIVSQFRRKPATAAGPA